MTTKPGRLLVVAAIAHVLVSVVAYRRAFADMLSAGLVNTVGTCLLNACGDLRPSATASFFLLVAPLLGLVGYLLDRAIAIGDARSVRAVAWVLLVVGIVSAPIAPLTPLWLFPPFGLWLLVLASRVVPAGRASS
jgi:uncharacterized membrane protein